ncbi:MAG: DUF4329 domain-containing protein [Pyrinomonadaceae bacterium]
MSFATADQAAAHILKIINPRSIIENFEYAGFIYKTENGYDFTIPRRQIGDWSRSNTSLDSISIPANAVEVGFYHTHGEYQYNSTLIPGSEHGIEPTPFGIPMAPGDHFSNTDLITANNRGRGISGYRAYLGTPSGVIYYYDPPNDANQHFLCRHNRPVIRR